MKPSDSILNHRIRLGPDLSAEKYADLLANAVKAASGGEVTEALNFVWWMQATHEYLDEEAERRDKFEADVLERLRKAEENIASPLLIATRDTVPLCTGGRLMHNMQGKPTCPSCGFTPKLTQEPDPTKPLYVGDGRPRIHLGHPDSLQRFGTGHPSEQPCIMCGRPTYDIIDRYQTAGGRPLCSKACFDRVLAAPAGAYEPEPEGAEET